MTSSRLKGRIAIVTGSSSGNGRAIASLLASEGGIVVCADVRPDARPEGYEPDMKKTTTELIAAAGGAAEFVQTDVSVAAQMKRLVAHTVATHGRVDVMVNNAGWFSELHTIIDETEEIHDRTMAVNEKGVWLGCKYAITEMVKQEPIGRYRGKIINIASVGGILGLPQEPAYCASKGAVVNLTRQLALDFGPQRIAVNAIAPGLIATGMVSKWLDDPKTAAAYDGTYSWPDRGQPIDVARMVAYLASDDSSYVHGAILSLDGDGSSGVHA